MRPEMGIRYCTAQTDPCPNQAIIDATQQYAASPPHAQEKELSHHRGRVSLRVSDGKLVNHTTEMIL